MFDPTVFDNLKVIVEGYIYDLDLAKEISVINRNDMIDLSRMSRNYRITYSHVVKKNPSVSLKIEMDQKHLSGELQRTIDNPGCLIELSFNEETVGQDYDELLLKKLKRMWGNEHLVNLFVTKEVTSTTNLFHHRYQIIFQSLFGEDDIENILQIVDYSISLLRTMSRT